MKKKKNPFKMWGSYIGVFVALFTEYFTSLPSSTGIFSNLLGISGGGINVLTLSNLGYYLAVILGFLIGWGIEVILRKNKMFGLK